MGLRAPHPLADRVSRIFEIGHSNWQKYLITLKKVTKKNQGSWMKRPTKKSAIYLGGGFVSSQLLWLLPIVDGFCERRGIENLVLEKPFPTDFESAPAVRQILERYTVRCLHNPRHGRFLGTVFTRLLRALGVLLPSFWLALVVSRSALLRPASWNRTQIVHAVWDTSCVTLRDGRLSPSFLRKLTASLRVLIAVEEARSLVRRHGVRSAFLGHAVYAWRGQLATFEALGVEVFLQGAHVLYKSPEGADENWAILPPQHWAKVSKLFNEAEAEEFWMRRSRGVSTYTDSKIASRKTIEVADSAPKNLLMLHIFRDSPFNQIDGSRAFADYIDWVASSLAAIATSREAWMVRYHPSATRWGENQAVWLQSIVENVFQSKTLPPNLVISDQQHSNIDLFRHVDRIVTFGGTPHLEAACWGKRPIAITKVGLAVLDPTAVLIPETQQDYAALLALPSDSPQFVLTQSQVKLARALLFAREKILRLGPNVGESDVYRGDGGEILMSNYDNVMRTVFLQYPALTFLGESLASGLPRSVNLDYLVDWAQSFAEV